MLIIMKKQFARLTARPGASTGISRLFLLGIAGIAFSVNAHAAVVEYFNHDLNNYFITADPTEQAFVDSGAVGHWQRTGNAFAAGGPNQVCRFYGNANINPATGTIFGPNSHFYTADPSECAGLKGQYTPTAKSWKFESNDFLTTPAINGACASGLVPVYRAYNNGFAKGIDSNHRITSNFAAYQQTIATGSIGEGIVMCAPPLATSTTLLLSPDGTTVYDIANNISWLANANLAASNRFGLPVCTPAADPKACVNASGSMSYQAAAAWVNAMNAANYLGHSNWQLPTTPSTDTTCPFVGPHGESFGFNCMASALGSLYYDALGLTAPKTAVPVPSQTAGPFSNFQPYLYWSQSPASGQAAGNATFSFNSGFQGANTAPNYLYLLPMIQGKIPGTPPATGQGLQVSPDKQTVYDPVTNVTWLANANLAASNTFGIAPCNDQSSPKPCVNQDGAMNLDSANQFVTNMNAYNGTGYLGQTRWVVPPVDASCSGYNCAGNASPMGELFYNQLGLSRGMPVVSAPNIDVGPFNNIQPYLYWACEGATISGACQADGPVANFEWSFSFGNGFQGTDILANDLYVTAYFIGAPAPPVPVPSGIYVVNEAANLQSTATAYATGLTSSSAYQTDVAGHAIFVPIARILPNITTWGQFNWDWTYVDTLVQTALSNGKKYSIALEMGFQSSSTYLQSLPSGFAATCGASCAPLFDVWVTGGSGGRCTSAYIPLPWVPKVQQFWSAAAFALAAHLKQTGAYGALTLIHLPGLSVYDEEIRLPTGSPAPATTDTQACPDGRPAYPSVISDATNAKWQAYGYSDAVVVNGFETIATAFEQAFPDRYLGLSLFNPGPNGIDFPNLTGDAAGAVAAQIVQAVTALAPGRVQLQSDNLDSNFAQTEVTTLAIQNAAAVGWQTNKHAETGAGCSGGGAGSCNPDGPNGPYFQLLQNGAQNRGAYVEVWSNDVVAYPLGIGAAKTGGLYPVK
jgi:hypothetical protein